jgi:hypothetical protein
MNISEASVCCMIGRGPATLGVFGRVIVFGLSLLFGWLALDSRVRVRPRFSHGKAPGMVLSKAERVILFVVALVMLLMAAGVIR